MGGGGPDTMVNPAEPASAPVVHGPLVGLPPRTAVAHRPRRPRGLPAPPIPHDPGTRPNPPRPCPGRACASFHRALGCAGLARATASPGREGAREPGAVRRAVPSPARARAGRAPRARRGARARRAPPEVGRAPLRRRMHPRHRRGGGVRGRVRRVAPRLERGLPRAGTSRGICGEGCGLRPSAPPRPLSAPPLEGSGGPRPHTPSCSPPPSGSCFGRATAAARSRTATIS